MPLTIVREIRPIRVAGPVKSSRVRLRSRDAACVVSVETSLDGKDWSPAHDGGPVPGLLPGDRPEAVHARVTMYWADSFDRKDFPMPEFRVDVACEWDGMREDSGMALVGGSQTGGN